MNTPENQGRTLQVEKAVYGGDGLARTETGEVVLVPYALPGETVLESGATDSTPAITVLHTSPERTEPRCVHFGVCGGCQYQMATYPAQLAIKAAILRETLQRAGVETLPELQIVPSPEPWGYRNRIRLRVREQEGALRLGYNRRGTQTFLPIRMCPIAAPVLWKAAELLLRLAAEDRTCREWIGVAAEVELVCSEDERQVQVHLLCPGAVPRGRGSFERFAARAQQEMPAVVSLGASRLHGASGRAMESLASAGKDGIRYRVGEDSFWLKRGSFFQVNRFLTEAMVRVIMGERHGALAWDLFAGAGLFARPLASRFGRVVGVEASPVGVEELRRGLPRRSDDAVRETTLAFLRGAVLQRERPELVVLDPPRAGAGEEVCRLLRQLAPAEIVYVSCDPTTLGRDLGILLEGGLFHAAEMHLLDLFPQTYHLETVMVLRRSPVEP